MILSVFYVCVFLNLSILANPSDSKPNCRLTVHTLSKGGKKRLLVDKVYAPSREACKYEALKRELDSKQDDEVQSVKVIFGYRGPAIY